MCCMGKSSGNMICPCAFCWQFRRCCCCGLIHRLLLFSGPVSALAVFWPDCILDGRIYLFSTLGLAVILIRFSTATSVSLSVCCALQGWGGPCCNSVRAIGSGFCCVVLSWACSGLYSRVAAAAGLACRFVCTYYTVVTALNSAGAMSGGVLPASSLRS